MQGPVGGKVRGTVDARKLGSYHGRIAESVQSGTVGREQNETARAGGDKPRSAPPAEVFQSTLNFRLTKQQHEQFSHPQSSQRDSLGARAGRQQLVPQPSHERVIYSDQQIRKLLNMPPLTLGELGLSGAQPPPAAPGAPAPPAQRVITVEQTHATEPEVIDNLPAQAPSPPLEPAGPPARSAVVPADQLGVVSRQLQQELRARSASVPDIPLCRPETEGQADKFLLQERPPAQPVPQHTEPPPESSRVAQRFHFVDTCGAEEAPEDLRIDLTRLHGRTSQQRTPALSSAAKTTRNVPAPPAEVRVRQFTGAVAPAAAPAAMCERDTWGALFDPRTYRQLEEDSPAAREPQLLAMNQAQLEEFCHGQIEQLRTRQ